MLHSSNSLIKLLEISGFEIVEITSVQRYGLSNHLYWLSMGHPGGHVIWDDAFSETTEASYQEDLVREGLADTIWCVARKKSV